MVRQGKWAYVCSILKVIIFFGRTGLGAIMGALLKAFCFRGNAEFAVKDKIRLMKVAKKLKDRFMASITSAILEDMVPWLFQTV